MICIDPASLVQFFTDQALPLDCRVLLSSIDSPQEITFQEYLPIFLATCALEAPFYIGFSLYRKLSLKKALLLLLLLNLATHPLVIYGFPYLTDHFEINIAIGTLLRELFAPIVEGILLKKLMKLGWIESILLAFVANLFSWWFGLYLFA